MTGTIAAAISDEPVLEPNSLASVTSHFIVIRNSHPLSFTIIPISRILGIEVSKKPYPGFLVISGGLFIVAAAAFSSKEGDGAGIPAALLGIFLLIIYFATRRASVLFLLDSGATEAVMGSVGEVTALVRLVGTAQRFIIDR